ncbi:8296_t:CDS:2 [Entrophospora sp. SA101]|nr:8296_t:CDS:2 [Entrophospora sp. SA101]
MYNNNISIIGEKDLNNNIDLDPLESIKDRGTRIVIENGFLACFQIFLLCLCIDAVTIILINLLITAYSIVALVENYIWLDKIFDTVSKYNDNNLNSIEINSNSKIFTIIQSSILVFSATLFKIFGYRLYKEFEWYNYQRTGASWKMQTIHKIYVSFILVLKLDLFFAWGFSIYYTYLSYKYWNRLQYDYPIATTIFLTCIVALFPLNILIIYLATTLILGIFVFATFKSGLKDKIEKSEKAPKKYNTGRFPIDDDDDEYEFSYSEDNHFIK